MYSRYYEYGILTFKFVYKDYQECFLKARPKVRDSMITPPSPPPPSFNPSFSLTTGIPFLLKYESSGCVVISIKPVIRLTMYNCLSSFKKGNKGDSFFILVSISMFYDEEHSKLFTAFNQQVRQK